MTTKRIILYNYTICMLFFVFGHEYAVEPPRITIIFVVDQCAYHYFPRLMPYFNHGFKLLTLQGVNYTNACYPHSMPATSTGHAGLNTGTQAWYHGIVGNKWFDQKGNLIHSDDDYSGQATLLTSCEVKIPGKSARNVMVDGISDQFVRAHTPDMPHYAYGVSLKSRAAVLTANKLGKAIWLEDIGQFTSSKAYFDHLPTWLEEINEQLREQSDATFTWHPVYPLDSPAYASVAQHGYNWSEHCSLIGKTFSFHDRATKKAKEFQQFMQLPQSNQLLLDVTKRLIAQHKDTDHLLIWLCLSSLDKVGHSFGPNSYETVDTLYHLDRQLGTFIKEMNSCYGSSTLLFGLTADHGVSPIPELLRQQGYLQARRIDAQRIRRELNRDIEKKFGIKDLIHGYKTPQFYLKPVSLKSRDKVTLIEYIKQKLMEQQGIKQVWTFDELRKSVYKPCELENFFKQQLYPGRSGEIVVQTFPYVQLTSWPKGTNHQTPYWYDTHVPLVLYRPGIIEKKTITQKVFTLQLANTLADILQVERPSASTFDPLPGIDYAMEQAPIVDNVIK